ncbi:hypothetical protein BABINDRAFT_159030 [Babjeviella inositovora NRRL Y-12698]|uniref:Rab-GAP TBC domain-containing protein n=1 Tax=Babjeviella inositovora NRRL Y-12698 TaxID=984486 RepID=A0A1E3QXN7_9ASCO|nr:uncharacterized protein BABINDRAFT_159030 [Babjeviella inositovora NRRL Y-12698]ODQ82435.1 hypothetical protein BABINDRAFT_159030 [Babjeviella inositovora NRRL Y-12698]
MPNVPLRTRTAPLARKPEMFEETLDEIPINGTHRAYPGIRRTHTLPTRKNHNSTDHLTSRSNLLEEPSASALSRQKSFSKLNSKLSRLNSQGSEWNQGLTPSQKLRLRRAKLNENITKLIKHNNFDADFSDDEIEGDVTMFNVPVSRTLSELHHKKKLVAGGATARALPHGFVQAVAPPEGFTSPQGFTKGTASTRSSGVASRSSLATASSRRSILSSRGEVDSMSSVEDVAETTDLFLRELLSLDDDARELSVLFNRSSMLTISEESTLRQNYLRKMNRSLFEHNNSAVDLSDIYIDESRNNSLSNLHSSGQAFLATFQANGSTDSLGKSKYMTPTRPSFLPPKAKDECSKHDREYDTMLSGALKKEQTLHNLKLAQLKKWEKQRERDSKKWVEDVLPKFDKAVTRTSTRELWWRGIPENLRGQVWYKVITGSTARVVDDAGVRIQDRTSGNGQTTGEALGSAQSTSKDSSFARCDDLISRYELNNGNPNASPSDVHYIETVIPQLSHQLAVSYPDLALLQSPAFFRSVFRVTLAYLIHSGDPLFPGLTNLATLLTHYIQNPSRALVALTALLARKLPRACITCLAANPAPYARAYLETEAASFDKVFREKNERLQRHFQIIGLTSVELFTTLLPGFFTNNLLAMDVTARLIDIGIFEGSAFMMRCIMGLFAKIDYKLFGDKDEVLAVLGGNYRETGQAWKYLDVGFEDDFVALVRSVLKKK